MKPIQSFFSLVLCTMFSGVPGLCSAQESAASANANSNITKASALVVRSKSELEEIMAKGPTPLDALTPYGKRQFLSHLSWGNRGLSGFSPAALLRELERDEAWEIYSLFGLTEYFPKKFPEGKALRFVDFRPEFEVLVHQFDAAFEQDVVNKGDGGASQTGMPLTLALYRKELKSLLVKEKLQKFVDGDLYLLFQCVETVSFALPNAETLASLNSIYEEFINRGVDTRRGLDSSLFRAMLKSRDFGNARKFMQSHPTFADQEIPELVDTLRGSGTRETVFVEQGNKWVRQLAPLKQKGAQLVIVLSESCGFCRQLMKDIDSDVALRTRFEKAQTLLVTDPSDTAPFELVKSWNKSHPHLRMYVPFSAREWKRFDKARVPHFVVVRDNKIVHSMMSWTKDGSSKTQLLALLDKVGL